jgi:hypothetical protein
MMLVIDDLREIARCCQTGEPMDERLTRWLGTSLKKFLEQNSRTIEEALGLQAPQGGVPWHLEEALRKRDATLRELVADFCEADSLSARARWVEAQAKRYAASAWRFDRDDDEMPARYRGTAKALLWRAFKSGARMPICERQLRNILAQ